MQFQLSSLHSPIGHSSYDLDIFDCLALSKSFPKMMFRFVKRSTNELVHAFAQMARFQADLQEWFTPPTAVLNILA